MPLCVAACMSVRVCGLTPEPFNRPVRFEPSPSLRPCVPPSVSSRWVPFRFVSRSPSTSQSDGKLFNCFGCSTPRACGRALFAVSYLLEAFHLPIFSQFKSALHENDNNRDRDRDRDREGDGGCGCDYDCGRGRGSNAAQAPKAAGWL